MFGWHVLLQLLQPLVKLVANVGSLLLIVTSSFRTRTNTVAWYDVDLINLVLLHQHHA